MLRFDKKNPTQVDKFIRHDPHFLKRIFGTEDVAPFWVADMDFAVADPIRDELTRLAERAQFAYEFDHKGVYSSIAEWFERRNALTLKTDSFVQVPGVLTGLALIIRELTNPGDGILIQTPAFHQFAKAIRSAERDVVTSPLKIVDRRYEMDFDDLEKKLASSAAKLIVLCNPHNPVGRVWTREEIRRTLELAAEHGVTVVSDEIFADMVMPAHSFTSIMSADEARHVALIGAPSKTFGMQSISNGYIYTTNETLLTALKKAVDSMFLGHANAFTTFATIAAFKHGDAWVDELVAYIDRTAASVGSFLAESLPSVSMYELEGTYELWLDFRAMGLAPGELVKKMGEARTGLTPGSWFSEDTALFARMNLASPRSEVLSALERLSTVLSSVAQ